MRLNLVLIKCTLIIFPMIIICACTKNSSEQKNKKLAQNYYKLSMLEFADKNGASSSLEESYKKALQHIQKAINYHTCADYLAVQATLLFRLNDFASSKDVFESALKLDSEPHVKACILNNYGCLLSQMGNNEKALQIFKNLEVNNAYLTPQAAIFNRGRVFFAQKDYKTAYQEFLRAVQRAPDFLDARYFLALSAFKLNDIKMAKSELKTILFLEPEHEGAMWLKNKIDGG